MDSEVPQGVTPEISEKGALRAKLFSVAVLESNKE
jgi:hypothetical protein